MHNNLKKFPLGVLTSDLIHKGIQTNPETQVVKGIAAKTRPRLAQTLLLVTTSLMEGEPRLPLVPVCTSIAALVQLRHLGHAV